MQIASHQVKKLSLRLILPAILVMLTVLIAWAIHSNSPTVAAASYAPRQWTYDLPSDMCPGTNIDDCHYGSPNLADINKDGFDDVIAVSNKGHIVALKHNGQLMWDTDVAHYLGMAAGTNEIHSSPSVADIDNDGQMEIAVGVGTVYGDVCTVGAVVVLDHLGKIQPGWPKIGYDNDIPPVGCPDSFFSSPALGDLDNDGDLEIIIAGYDKRIYAWHHDGTLLPGFPPPSNLSLRFPKWPNLRDRLADNTWGSASLVDLNNDGFLDIVIATGEGNFDGRYGGDSGGWHCPYELPAGWAPGYCGGSIYAFNRFGELMPGFPRYFLEAFGSSPAIADTDGDGVQEIYVGTSRFYHTFSPNHPTYGFKLWGIDARGNDLPSWEGGIDVGGTTSASPSIGDIAGDGNLEIVIAANDLKLYAFHSDGKLVAGFPMKPVTQTGHAYLAYENGVSFPLADYDGDGKMEIFVNQTWNVVVVDGNGQQLTSTNYPSDPRPTFYAEGNLLNTPVIGDIDNDGRLELVASNSRVSVWDLPQSSGQVHWPGFGCDAAREGRFCQPQLAIMPNQVTMPHQEGDSGKLSYSVNLQNAGGEPVSWSSDPPVGITVSPKGGTIADGERVQLTVTVPTKGVDEGIHSVGAIEITSESQEHLVNGSDQDVSLFVGDLTQHFFPLVIR